MLVATRPLHKARRKPPARRFVDRPSAREEWQAIHFVADQDYPLFRRIFLDAFGNLRDGLDMERLVAVLFAGTTRPAEFYIDEVWRDIGVPAITPRLTTAIASLMSKSAIAGTPFLEEFVAQQIPGAQLGILFNLQNPRVQEYIDNYVADRVVMIGEPTRDAIKGIVSRGFAEGRTVDQMARQIRDHIGLLPRQVTALERFEQTLIDAKVPPSRRKARLEARARRMIRQRARNIARTETINASSAGQHQLWLQARDEGWVNPNLTRRVWIVTPDDRLCPICAPIPSMNPNGVGLEEPFNTPDGPRMHPAQHPSCRCSTGLKFIGDT